MADPDLAPAAVPCPSPWRALPAWAWPLLAAAAAVIAMAPHLGVILGRAELFYDDHRRFTVPMATLAAESICRGELPAWNPYVGVGVPLLADPQTLALYPGLLLACVLPASHALGLLFVLQLGILAAGLVVLLGQLGVRPGVAVGAAAASALCGPAVSWLTSGPYLVTLSFFPWVVLAAWRLGRSEIPRVPSLVGLGVALGLAFLGGDVPGALVEGAVAAGVGWCAEGAGDRRASARPRVQRAAAFAAAIALALLIGAATWLPLSWYVSRSVRSAGLSAVEAGRWSWHPAQLVGWLIPHPLGLPLPENTFWAFGWIKQPRLFVHSDYVSALLVAFAAVAAFSLWRDRFVRAAAIAMLCLLLVATGSTTPLWAVLKLLFAYVRYPSKFAPYAVILASVLGAVGLSRGVERPGRSAWVAAGVAALAALAALALPALQGRLARAAGAEPQQIAMAAQQLREGAWSTAVCALVACALFFVAARGAPMIRRHLAALAGIVLIADAATAGSQLWWTVPAPRVTPRPAWLAEPGVSGARVIRAGELDRLKLHRTKTGYLEGIAHNERLLQPLTNVQHRTGALEGYGLALGDIFNALTAVYHASPLALAEVAAVDFVLVPSFPRQPWIAPGLSGGRLTVEAALRHDGAVVLRPTQALPRAFLATDYQVLDQARELPAVLAGDYHRGPILRSGEALVGGHCRAQSIHPDAPATPGPLQPVSPAAWAPAKMRFDVNAGVPSLLVVMDAFADGWHASVDGRAVGIHRANLVGRAVSVPAGVHAVTFWFDVPTFRWAARAPTVGLIIALVLLLANMRKVPRLKEGPP